MYAYCTERLHLSEAEAYLRIAAARASRQHPILLAMLADGRLHLTAIAKLAPHLTPDNRDAVLDAGHPLLEAPGRGARGRVGAPSRCAGSHPEAARAPAHRSFPDERATSRRPDRRLLLRTPSRRSCPAVRGGPHRCPVRAGPGSGRSDGIERRTPSGRSRPRPVSHRGGSPGQRPAPRPRALPRPVHRQRRAARQAREAPGAPPLLRPRRRPRRRHRRRRHREARKARGPPLRSHEGPPQEPLADRDEARLAPRPCRRPPGRARAGRGPLSLRRRAGPTMHGPPRSRIPPPPPRGHGW